MTRLLLVRHGETDWNRLQRHQGQKDIPLNALGRQQVEAVAQCLASERIEALYASDLNRAWKTATAISTQHDGLMIVKDSRLREMHFGEWEGLTWEQILRKEPAAADNWSKILIEAGPPGGENLVRFARRIQEASDEIIKTHPDDTVLVVAHAGTIMILICLLLDHPIEKYWQFRIAKASLSEIEVFHHGAIINQLNGISHLNEVERDN